MKVFIFAEERSGSNLFRRLLEHNFGIYNFVEKSSENNITSYNYKMHAYQIRHEKSDFISTLQDAGYTFFYTARRNKIKQAISYMIAFGDRKVDREHIEKCVAWLSYEQADLENRARDIPLLTITYEDDLINLRFQDETLDKIQQILNLDFVDIPQTFSTGKSECYDHIYQEIISGFAEKTPNSPFDL